MTRRLGGIDLDSRRVELSPLEQEPQRGIASGVRGVQPLCGYPNASIHQTVAQAVAKSVWTTILMDGTQYDVDDEGMADLANERLVISFPGIYVLTGEITWAAAAGGSRFARFLINTATPRGEAGGYLVDDSQTVRTQCIYTARLLRGDTVKLQGFQAQTAAASLNTVPANGDLAPRLACSWVGWAS